MLESAILLSTVLAIINATVPVGDGSISVPLLVQQIPTADATQPAIAQTIAAPTQAPAANIAGITIDQTTLTAIITPIIAAVGGLVYKNKKDSEKEDTRSNLMADVQMKQVYSLQETDKADYIFKTALVEYLDNPNEENKSKLRELANKSRQEYSIYYENIKPQPMDYNKDEVVKKLSAVDKRVTPSE